MGNSKIVKKVENAIAESVKALRGGKEIFQESDWKSYLYYLLKPKLMSGEEFSDFQVHTEVKLPGYDGRQKCDLALFRRENSNLSRGEFSFSKPVAGVELKMHGGRSKKWDNSSYWEKREDVIKDFNRLVKCSCERDEFRGFVLFWDGEADKAPGLRNRRSEDFKSAIGKRSQRVSFEYPEIHAKVESVN